MSYLTYFHKLPALLQVLDDTGHIIDVSDEWLRRCGYQRSAVVGQAWSSFITPATHERVLHEYWPALQTRSSLTDIEVEFVRPNGSAFAVTAALAVERAPAGDRAWYLIVATAASTQQPAEQLLLDWVSCQVDWGRSDYFQRLVSQLTTVLPARYALVTECIDPALTRVRTLAYLEQQNFLDNIEYAVADTPCAGVIAGSLCYYPDQLNTRFKMDLGEESYLGTPLWGAHGQVIGHLALLDDKPMHYNTAKLAVVQSFALQAALVLENQQLHRRLGQWPGWPEQRQLARQLQDSVMQALFSLTLLSAGWQRLLRSGQPVEPDSWLTELRTVSQQALHELRLLTTAFPLSPVENPQQISETRREPYE